MAVTSVLCSPQGAPSLRGQTDTNIHNSDAERGILPSPGEATCSTLPLVSLAQPRTEAKSTSPLGQDAGVEPVRKTNPVLALEKCLEIQDSPFSQLRYLHASSQESRSCLTGVMATGKNR